MRRGSSTRRIAAPCGDHIRAFGDPRCSVQYSLQKKFGKIAFLPSGKGGDATVLAQRWRLQGVSAPFWPQYRGSTRQRGNSMRAIIRQNSGRVFGKCVIGWIFGSHPALWRTVHPSGRSMHVCPVTLAADPCMNDRFGSAQYSEP